MSFFVRSDLTCNVRSQQPLIVQRQEQHRICVLDLLKVDYINFVLGSLLLTLNISSEFLFDFEHKFNC